MGEMEQGKYAEKPLEKQKYRVVQSVLVPGIILPFFPENNRKIYVFCSLCYSRSRSTHIRFGSS